MGYGLAASVVTNDLRRAMTFVDRIEAGVVKVNEPTTGLALQAPFGGFKQSSANTFKEQGPVGRGVLHANEDGVRDVRLTGRRLSCPAPWSGSTSVVAGNEGSLRPATAAAGGVRRRLWTCLGWWTRRSAAWW